MQQFLHHAADRQLAPELGHLEFHAKGAEGSGTFYVRLLGRLTVFRWSHLESLAE